MSEKGDEKKSTSMTKDYFFLTEVISLISLDSSDIRKRFCSYFLVGSFLVIAIPFLINEVYDFYLYEEKTLVLIVIWMLIAPILIDYFEYLIDDFKEKFKKNSIEDEESRKNFDDLFDKILNKGSTKDSTKYVRTNYVTVAISIPIHVFVSFNIPRILSGISYWSDLHWIMIILSYPIVLMGTIIFYLAAKNVYYIKDLCKEPEPGSKKGIKIKVDPYAGDRFGNLSIIGNYTIMITVLFSTFSFFIPHAYVRTQSLTGWEQTIPMVIMGLVLLGTLSTFIVPLYHVNRLAAKKKGDLLRKVSETLEGLRKEIDNEKVNTSDIRNRYYVHLEHYRNILDMKEWPFDTKTFIALIGSILLPIIFTVIPYTIGTP